MPGSSVPKLRSATGFLLEAFGGERVWRVISSSAASLTAEPSNARSPSVCHRVTRPSLSLCWQRRSRSAIDDATSPDVLCTRKKSINSALYLSQKFIIVVKPCGHEAGIEVHRSVSKRWPKYV